MDFQDQKFHIPPKKSFKLNFVKLLNMKLLETDLDDLLPKTVAELAKKAGCSVQAVYKKIKEKYGSMVGFKRVKVRKLHSKGIKPSEISKKTGIPLDEVYKLLEKKVVCPLCGGKGRI